MSTGEGLNDSSDWDAPTDAQELHLVPPLAEKPVLWPIITPRLDEFNIFGGSLGPSTPESRYRSVATSIVDATVVQAPDQSAELIVELGGRRPQAALAETIRWFKEIQTIDKIKQSREKHVNQGPMELDDLYARLWVDGLIDRHPITQAWNIVRLVNDMRIGINSQAVEAKKLRVLREYELDALAKDLLSGLKGLTIRKYAQDVLNQMIASKIKKPRPASN